MMSVPITTTGNTFRYGNPRVLFEGPFVSASSARAVSVLRPTPAGIEKTMSMYANEVDFEDVPLGHKESTAAGVQKFFTSFTQSGSQHRFVVTNWAGDENGGAMEWTWYCKHEAEILGVPAKGKQTEVRGISYIGLRSGKIIAERDYFDCPTLLRQLGALQ